MNESDRSGILKIIHGCKKGAEKCKSLDEKRKFFYNALDRVWPFLGLSEDVKIDDPFIEDLVSDFLSINIGSVQIFEGDGYHPWLEDLRNDIDWKFYDRYEEYLYTQKNRKSKVISSINKTSDIILDHMGNPRSDSFFHKKGLVIGDIQSGKTANYTAVINKAIDAGYKIIIVLAGLTRDLRNQTQKRLDAEVLGYKTVGSSKGSPVGVGTINQFNIEGLTYEDSEKDFGDLRKYFSTHTLDKDLNPIVAIVKKNKSILKNLKTFLTSSQINCYTNHRLDIPVLIVDDEVDQASVDTKNGDNFQDSSTINRMIREILNQLNRYSYVGYTATPFANVFIDPDKNDEKGENPDLYPKDFILSIPSNDDYCGIKEFFGVDVVDDSENTNDHTNDLFVEINDYRDLFAANNIDSKSSVIKLNNSIKNAIKSYIIACAVKKSRGFLKHNSMLVHIARFKNPSNTLKEPISDYIDDLYSYLKYEKTNAMKMFKEFWENNFKNVSKDRLGDDFTDTWENISQFIIPTVSSIACNIIVLNGDSGDTLDYESTTSGDYIVIGGDKLSRGLTLEGLVTSYYYRRSNAYDTLLQMGRWFGYRKGWIDVCRVFTTVRFMNDFITVGKVLQKFKDDLNEMYVQRINPREVGQRILYSPNLIPTARNKMRNSTKLKISFSGEVQQIITFDRKFVADNLNLTRNFVDSLGNGEIRAKNKVVFNNVDAKVILDYLSKYKECSDYYGYGHISIGNWIKYIKHLNELGELRKRTVVLNSLSTRKEDYDNSEKIGRYLIYKPSRTLRDPGDSSKFELYTVKANNDPSDFREIFPTNSKEYSEVKSYDSKISYRGFDFDHALMAIYVVDLFEKVLTGEYDKENNREVTKRGKIIIDGKSVTAPAIWFPKAKDYESSATDYYVSKDYLEHERQLEKEDNELFGEYEND